MITIGKEVNKKGMELSQSSLKYSQLSLTLTKEISKSEKKENGIYFTPPEIIHKNLEFLKPFLKNIKKVLEPSCGSCEYILRLRDLNSTLTITGMELNKKIFDSISQYNSDNVKLVKSNYLTHRFDNNKFDLIIGNPPYYVMKKNEVESSYYKYFDGRPNIFVLFIIKSLELLSYRGILSFVLPKNFLNCLYYDKTRKLIFENYKILNIIECSTDKYLETQQDTIIFVVQKLPPPVDNNVKYSINISNYIIFGTEENIMRLKDLYKKSKTLFNMNFIVSVGNIVWNQWKKELTDDYSKTLLVYSSDIVNNKLEIKQYSNEEKRNYINKKGKKDPLLVINRGYGTGSYSFNYCIINENDDIEYLIENHLICIEYKDQISKENLIKKYKKIIKSFKNVKTVEFIKLYFGNNAINTTELCKILPIYDI